jgi:hypothetical protein
MPYVKASDGCNLYGNQQFPPAIFAIFFFVGTSDIRIDQNLDHSNSLHLQTFPSTYSTWWCFLRGSCRGVIGRIDLDFIRVGVNKMSRRLV